MRFSALASLVTILAAAAGAGAWPAAAQTLPMDLFRADRPFASFATDESVAEGFTLSAAPPPTASFRPWTASRTVAAAAPPQVETNEEALTPPKPPPLPPKPVRAAAPQPAPQEPIRITPAPVVTAAVEPAAPVRREPLSQREIIERANAYFTDLGTLVASFTQVGGDGRRMRGTLYLQRPGKIRFEYDPPATLEVIADGASVAVRDKKLLTQDMYFIHQTPLKFLLREKVNLGRDIAVTGTSAEPNSVRLDLADSSTLGGTSRITLYFDPEMRNLTQWRIVDPQGFQTIVALNKVERGRTLDQSLFRIPNAPNFGPNN